MKTAFKKSLALVLAAVMLLCALPFTASAAIYSGTCGTNLTWSLNTDTGVLNITGTGAMKNWSSSSSVPWNSYRSNIKSVNIGNSVTTIGGLAFTDCYSLTSVTIPDSVTTIGNYAFRYCTSLTSVTIGNSVTTIGDYSFARCDSLTKITVDANNKYYSSDTYGVLFNKDKTTLIKYPVGNTRTSYTIPDSVTTIGVDAFYNCYSLTSVTIPDSVATIGEWAFAHCANFTSVTIGNSVTTIGDHAFYNCSSLTSIRIPDSIATIGYSAFSDCDNLTSVTIPDSVTTIGDSAFSSCYNLTSVTIGNSVTTISDIVFADCDSLISITIPNSVTTIGDGALYNCDSLTDVYYTGTEEQWQKISIGSDNEPLMNATIHYNYTESEHVHTPKIVTIPASCTVNGMEYTVCEGCGEPLGEPMVIPASHKPGEWETEIEATTESEGKRVKRCTVCGEITDTEIIPKKALSKVIDDESGIVIEYDGDDYDGEVSVNVTESFDGAAFNLINTETNSTQTFIYDITMSVDGENVQPKGKVTVRIPLPENYDPARTFVYHVNTATGKVEPMSAKFEDGFMVFETTHFSYYAVVEQLDVKLAIKQPSVTTINYGETLVLQLEDVEVPEGYKIEWSIIGDAVTISVSEDGKECRVTSTASGNVSVTATLVDENGEPVPDNLGNNIESFINILSKAGFWQKLISFFKNLFRINRIIY